MDNANSGVLGFFFSLERITTCTSVIDGDTRNMVADDAIQSNYGYSYSRCNFKLPQGSRSYPVQFTEEHLGHVWHVL